MFYNDYETSMLGKARQEELLAEAKMMKLAKIAMQAKPKKDRFGGWLSRTARNVNHTETDNATEWVEYGLNANLRSI